MTKNIEYKKVIKADNLPLADMIKDVFEEYDAPREGTVFSDPTTDNLFKLFERKRSVLWVAKVDGKAVGCCGLYPTNGLDNDTVELVKYYLNNVHRGKGIGKMLMSKCISSARVLGYKQLYLESLAHFEKAVAIYEKLGFRRVALPLSKSEHPACNIWMVKEL